MQLTRMKGLGIVLAVALVLSLCAVLAPAQKAEAAGNPSVSYQTHVQKQGWQGWKKDGQSAGTSGKSLRLEGIKIKLSNKPVSGGIQYRTHVQTYGWQGWKSDGAMSGTQGQSKRLEAIQIKLTGEMANQYDVYYRVHAQQFGWMGWAKNGASAGTAGYSYRLEAIQIKLVKKGGKAPGSTANSFKNLDLNRIYGEFYLRQADDYDSYQIVDLDKNGTKDLLIAGYNGQKVYTYDKKKGKIVHVKSEDIAKNAPTVYYNTSRHTFMFPSGNTGGIYYTVYKLQGKSAKKVATFEYANGKHEGPWYKVNGKKVSKSKYNKEFKKYSTKKVQAD